MQEDPTTVEAPAFKFLIAEITREGVSALSDKANTIAEAEAKAHALARTTGRVFGIYGLIEVEQTYPVRDLTIQPLEGK